MPSIAAIAVTPGTVIDALHPITGAHTARVVTRVSVHPTQGVTIWYADPFGPTRHVPFEIMTTIVAATPPPAVVDPPVVPPPPVLPNLIVTAISMTPTSPRVGDHVIFSATIQNVGTVPTPAGVIHDVLFGVDSSVNLDDTWSDVSIAPLAAGASRTLQANSGALGVNYWVATGGLHSLSARVNTRLPGIAESTLLDNSLTIAFTPSAVTSITKTDLTSGSDTTDGTVFTTASIAPTANRLVLVAIAVQDINQADIAATTVVGGGSLAYTLCGSWSTYRPGGSQRHVAIFRSMSASPSAGALTITFSGVNLATNVEWSVAEFDVVNTGGSNGSAAIVQTVGATGGDVQATSGAVALAAFGSANNATFGAFSHATNEATTPGSGFTEIHDVSLASSLALETEWRNDNDTSVDASWATSAYWAAVAVEIRSASNAPYITAGSPPAATQGQPYSFALQATGDTPFTWTKTGTLPTGLSLNASTGIISGTPTALGTFSPLTFTATNAVGSDTTPTKSITVSASGARQPVLAWLSTLDLDSLLGNAAGGVTLQSLKNNGVGGSTISLGVPGGSPIPSWQISEWQDALAYGSVNVGYYIASSSSPLPATAGEVTAALARWQTLADAANAAGLPGLAGDGEPYGYPGGGDDPTINPWCVGTTAALMTSYGQQLGAIIATVGSGTFHLYSSSNGSWPGSYNDLIRIQAGGSGSYANSKYKYFVQGLLDGGAKVTLTDASFHIGVQLAADGGNWATGTAHSVSLAKSQFPSALFSASIMIWPDIDEGSHAPTGSGFFSAGAVQDMADGGSANSTGPMFLYQHNLATGPYASYWLNTALPAIKAGVGA